jgi:hypothetical protein
MERTQSWRSALSLFAYFDGSTIVETGCQRLVEDWGAGCSTRIVALFLKEIGHGKLHSVDHSLEHIGVAHRVVEADNSSDYVEFHHDDSVHFLTRFNQMIDLLYLDSFDYSDAPLRTRGCQEHQLKEITAAFEKLSDTAIVLLDDNDLPHGGKTRLTKEFLRQHGWTCLLDWQQSLWVRPLRANLWSPVRRASSSNERSVRTSNIIREDRPEGTAISEASCSEALKSETPVRIGEEGS